MLLRVVFAVCVLCFVPSLSAAEVQWKMHTINAQSEFPACAAFDIDHDGDVDIYSGGFWYEAPTWQRHKVRDVEVIRGRYDDYSNQPMDCNGDGWLDIISVNYRSETIYWIEHPGKNLHKQDWIAHVIDKPGPSETGRLYDIDGDGDLDILPNGTTYAAWYEFAPVKKDNGLLEPKWIKHDLPKEMAGHGIGIHVVPNGEPRIISAKGDRWAHWRFPKDFSFRPFSQFDEQNKVRYSLHADASVPILPYVVERSAKGDPGDSFWIWGRGHRTGLYYRSDNSYVQAIDTSWSQCHAPLLVDIDRDGKLDIVAGKRFMGHEGKDPGEFDPLVMYWYQYLSDSGTWQRHVVHEGGPAGMDLDPKAIDLDDDGDVDLIAPSRNGLYLFENLLVNRGGTKPDELHVPVKDAYPEHSRLLVYSTPQGDLRPVKNPTEWARRRWDIVRAMEGVMGKLPNPSERMPVRFTKLDEAKDADGTKTYDRFTIEISSDRQARAVRFVSLLVPKKASKPLPAMLCLHPTSLEHGRKIVTGEAEAKNRNYAHELAERGYVCICPDYPTMGENPFDRTTTHKHYESGTMKAIWDNVRCLDVLESLGFVDPDRIGVIGHSLGGHNGMFTACFDQRIKCVVTSCGFTPFHDYYGGKLDGWAQDRYMPKIRTVYNNDPNKLPFDFYEVLGALAPRSIFINAPLHDSNFDVGGVKKAVLEAQKVYDLLGAKNGITARYPDCAHDFPDEVREEVYQWLDKQLKP